MRREGAGTVIKPFPAGLSFISSRGRVIFLLETIWVGGAGEKRMALLRVGGEERCSTGTTQSTWLASCGHRLHLPLSDGHIGRGPARWLTALGSRGD